MKPRIDRKLYFQIGDIVIEMHTGRINREEGFDLEVIANDKVFALIDMDDLKDIIEALQNYYKYLGG